MHYELAPMTLPFGCGAVFQSLEQHSHQGLPWMKPVRARRYRRV